jgi:DTW domain-containing protein YfiP
MGTLVQPLEAALRDEVGSAVASCLQAGAAASTAADAVPTPCSPSSGKRRNRLKDKKPHPTYGLSKRELQDCQCTVEEYEAKRQQRLADRAVLDAVIHRKDVEGPVKQHTRCSYILRWGRTLFQCERCWLLPGNCICGRLQQFNTDTHIALFVHHDEWRKGSNTGCITHLSLSNSQMRMRGYQPHDQAIAALLADPTYTVAVLWPGANAVTPQQLQQVAQEKSGGRVAIIALDATWDNAKRMQRKVPEGTLQLTLPPDLSLNHGGAASLFAPLRKYSVDAQTSGRVCTLEAVAAALLALEPPGSREALYQGLLHNLKIKVDAMRRQKNMEEVYAVL